AARSQERRRFGILEQQYKDQLSERNAMFLTIWKRLSSMCGPDWAHSNSLINGNLPSQEVIGNMLFWPGFSKNLLLSVKTVENMLNNFKSQIKAIERDLTRQYQTLEHTLGLRFKKLERLEEAATTIKIQMNQQQHHKSRASIPGTSTSSTSHETKQLKSEIKFLRAELNLSESRNKKRSAAGNSGHVPKSSGSNLLTGPYANSSINSSSSGGTSAEAITPEPSHTSTEAAIIAPSSNRGTGSAPFASDPASQRWIERLHELERRLKVEREARLLDRDGARRRLQERDATNEELKAQLERQLTLHDYDLDSYQRRSRHSDPENRAVITSSRASHIRDEDVLHTQDRTIYDHDVKKGHGLSSIQSQQDHTQAYNATSDELDAAVDAQG
ncbi:Anucleate primary sterigmata protein B, partial [Ascosphaera aggregata]